MRKFFAMLPGILMLLLTAALVIVTGDVIPLLLLWSVLLLAGGILTASDRHLPGLIPGAAVVIHCLILGLTAVPHGNDHTGGLYFIIAGTLVLYTICYCITLAVYRRELNKS